jgi:thioredoxin 1
MTVATQSVTDTTFADEVLASPVPVLVDFWAEWCTPCKMIGPLVEESAATYAGRLKVAKLNVDDNPAIASRYRVRSIPTLLLFENGVPVATQIGALSKAQLAAFVEANLKSRLAV